MKNWMRTLFGVALLLGLTTPAFATGILNDSEAPGSVLVFHKFVRGTQNNTSTGALEPKTELEISVTCPKGETCILHQNVYLRGHWVCPGDLMDNCAESDFTLTTTVKGTLYINPENIAPNNHQVAFPPPGCQNGYLIVWVIDDPLTSNPIKFDGLIGNGVIRNGFFLEKGYNAVPIQAASSLGNKQRTDVDWQGDLDFDGTEYQAVTGKVFGTVRYEGPPNTVRTNLTLLTLDVKSNRSNPRTYADFIFYNAFEVDTSASHNFVCWTEVRLTAINAGFTEAVMGRKGLVESDGVAVNALGRPVTLIGIVETTDNSTFRENAYSLFNDGTPIKTRFVP